MGDLPLRGFQVPGRAQPPTGSTAVDAGQQRAGQLECVVEAPAFGSVVVTHPAKAKVMNRGGATWVSCGSGQPASQRDRDNPLLTSTTGGCQNGGMAQRNADHQQAFERLRQVRAEALEHTMQAQRLARERRDLIRQLIADGFSQADVARELGVTRQAIQKMLAC